MVSFTPTNVGVGTVSATFPGGMAIASADYAASTTMGGSTGTHTSTGAGFFIKSATPAPPSDGFTTAGIYGPDTIYGSLSDGSHSTFGSFFARGLNGPVAWTLGGADATRFYLTGPNGSTIGNGGLYYGAQKSSYNLTLTATDGATTLPAKNITVQAVANSVQMSSNYVVATAPGGGQNAPSGSAVQAMAFARNNLGTLSGTSSDGILTYVKGDFDNDYLYTTPAASPLSGHYGEHDVTVTDGTSSFILKTWIIEEQAPLASFTQAAAVYSNAPSGMILGSVSAYSDAGISSISVSPSWLTISGNHVKVRSAPAAGTYTVTITVVSGTGASSSVLTFSLPVGQGITLPASNITPSFSSLDNSQANMTVGPVAVGTVTVSGIRNPTWTIDVLNDECQLLTSYGSNALQPRYSIAPSSTNAATIMAANLSAQTDTLIVSATAGATTCVGQLPLPVAAKSGPAITVDAASPVTRTNFHTWNDWNIAYIQNYATYAGSVVTLAQQDYSNDFSTLTPGHGSNEEWAPGPYTLAGVSPSNRTVIDYQNKDALDDKGLINCVGADITVRNIEVARCISYNNVAAFYKEEQKAGNFSLYDFYARNSSNGFLNADLGAHITMQRGIVAFCGAGVVSRDHNIYVGHASQLTVDSILSFSCAGLGHLFKTRALRGSISNSKFLDSVNGSASQQLDIPSGGTYTVTNCVFMKGPSADNPFCVSFLEEWNNSTVNPPINTTPATLLIDGCTFMVVNNRVNPSLGTISAICVGYGGGPTSVPVTLTFRNCKFYGIPQANWINNQCGATVIDGGGNVAVTTWTDLQPIDPSTGAAIVNQPTASFQTDNGIQGVIFTPTTTLQWRIAVGAAVGTFVGQVSSTDVYGVPLSSPTFSLANDDGGNFSIDSSGAFRVANASISDGIRYIQVAMTGTDSHGAPQSFTKWTWIVVGNGTLIS